MAFNVNHLLGDPMANMAMAYGSSIASHGKEDEQGGVAHPQGKGGRISGQGWGIMGSHLIRTAAFREGADRTPRNLGSSRPQPPLSLLAAPFVSVNKLKWSAAVDTAYVAKKPGCWSSLHTHQVRLPG